MVQEWEPEGGCEMTFSLQVTRGQTAAKGDEAIHKEGTGSAVTWKCLFLTAEGWFLF